MGFCVKVRTLAFALFWCLIRFCQENTFLTWFSRYFCAGKEVLTINTKHYDKSQKLTFRIVDSPMGIGKSSSLLDYLRFGAFYFKDESYIESLRRTGLFNDLQKARFPACTSRCKPWELLQGSSATTPLVDFRHRLTACPSYEKAAHYLLRRLKKKSKLFWLSRF